MLVSASSNCKLNLDQNWKPLKIASFFFFNFLKTEELIQYQRTTEPKSVWQNIEVNKLSIHS